MKYFCFIILYLLINIFPLSSQAHTHSESAYQHAWCSANGGVEEVKNADFTRVDCLTKTHAVEFDFANKWAESIGQALYYGLMTEKRPKVVLDGKDNYLEAGQSIDIPIQAKHSLQNPYDADLKIIEVQKGDYISEDDIIRYEDMYGRV